jgi:hypothetical protein
MTRLTDRGRRVRVLLTAAFALVLVSGTLWGQDDDFPFGPFRMYSTAPDPNGAARDTRVEGVDSAGRVLQITEANSGIRRAEIEGQQAAFVADPALMSRIAAAYAKHVPGSPPLQEVRIVIRWHEIRDSRPVGGSRDEVVARWVRS